MQNTKVKQGFTLVEMSVIIIIIAVFIAMSMEGMGGAANTARYASTKNKIMEIKKSLYKFYQANGRLPCPAQFNLLPTSADFGLEIYSETYSGTKAGCNPSSTPAGSFTVPASSGMRRIDVGGGVYAWQGAVPIRTLNLRDDMMIDSYEDRFTYLVTEKFTTGTSVSPVTIDGVITVNDGATTPNIISSTAVFAVISHGSDREGGYKKDGTASVTCGSTAGIDDENCDADGVLSDAQFNDLNKTSGAWFDDIIVWANSNEIQHWFDQ